MPTKNKTNTVRPPLAGWLGGKSKLAAALSGCKPYVLNQALAKLVNNRLIIAPYENQGTKYIPLESFYVLAKHIKFSEDVYEEIVTGYQRAESQI